MRAKRFATVSNGVIVSLNDAIPEHDLLPNQFPLSDQEYWLLRAVREVEGVDLITHIHLLAEQIQSKLDGVKNAEG